MDQGSHQQEKKASQKKHHINKSKNKAVKKQKTMKTKTQGKACKR